ncbi:MAG TPA: M15 family metallopeptidase [Treponema sp.]|nr:M15 family metallopeptidase [Treponema sp.]
MYRRFFCFIAVAIFCVFQSISAEPAARSPENPHIVLRAFLIAYPEKVTDIDYDFDVGDWYMTVRGTRLYWAQGRLLRKEDRGNFVSWRPYVDYLYPEKVPNPAQFTPEILAQINSHVFDIRDGNSPSYNLAFYDLLYDGATRRSVEANITRVDYLGLRVSVHRDILPQLLRVEKKILDLAEENSEVRRFVDTIGTTEGYNWREVEHRPVRSNHSWGIAVDILPVKWGKKNIYWYWLSHWNKKWMLISPDRRWAPPDEVIEIFESEGFIWGGKWLLWDTMHFEYRPELLVLQRWGYTGEGI